MDETLISTIIASGVILPHDLAPDDHPVAYDNDGIPLYEMLNHADPDEELLEDFRNYATCIPLAIGYYNDMNGTDYVLCDIMNTFPPPRTIAHLPISSYYNKADHASYLHFAFYAAPSSDSSAAKPFFCDFDTHTLKFARCCMIDGLPRCEFCDVLMFHEGYGTESSEDEEASWSRYYADVPPPSSYSGDLAEGVILSDKAKLRLKVALPALAYYNKKQHTNYKLVDALPYCESSNCPPVAHCNFIARQADSPNKLFFAELELHDKVYVVVACLVVRGKTTAGCHCCPIGKRAKQVIHPTRGFRYGLFRHGTNLIRLRPRKSY